MKASRRICSLLMGALMVFQSQAQNQGISAIYSGGTTYYGRDHSVRELSESGFNTLIVWTIHVNATGVLNFNGEFELVRDGVYVGDQTYPHFRSDLKEFKSAASSINRIEFGLSAWQSGTYDNIKALYEAEGVGPGSTLYENFKALIEAIPEIDAFNNDDEGTYDVESSVAFHTMLYDLGVKTTGVPYTRATSYWKPFTDQMLQANPGSVEYMYLQVYAGGSGNNPCSSSWQDLGVPIVPGLWGEGSSDGTESPQEVETKMTGWANSCGINGGFMWLYAHFDKSDQVAAFANAINTSFGITAEKPLEATEPSPADGSAEVSVDADLLWKEGGFDVTNNVYLGTSPDLQAEDLVYQGSADRFDVGTLPNGETYYWRVDQENTGGSTTGQVWSFTTELVTPAPEKVEANYGNDPAPTLAHEPVLTWDAADHAVSYKVYFGDETSPELVKQSQDTFYVASELEMNSYYYLRVDAVNSAATTTGDEWELMTRSEDLQQRGDLTYSSQDSDRKWHAENVTDGVFMNGEEGEWGSNDETNPWIQLDWDKAQALGTIVLYDRAQETENILSATLKFSDGSILPVGALPTNGEAHVIDFDRIDASWVRLTIDSYEGERAGLAEIEIYEHADPEALPELAGNFEPENGYVADVDTYVTLRWERGAYSEHHSLYISQDEIVDETDLVLSNASTFYVLYDLEFEEYYWRVDPVNKNGTTTGEVQYFKTEKSILGSEDDLAELVVYPNPAQKNVTIEGPFEHAGKVEIRVRDQSGKVIFTDAVENSAGQVHWNLINSSRQVVPSGLYFLEIITGAEYKTFKVLVK